MKAATFFRGMCVGMVAGAAVDMVLGGSKPKPCKTTVGKAVQRMGNAVDGIARDFGGMLH